MQHDPRPTHDLNPIKNSKSPSIAYAVNNISKQFEVDVTAVRIDEEGSVDSAKDDSSVSDLEDNEHVFGFRGGRADTDLTLVENEVEMSAKDSIGNGSVCPSNKPR